jgi:Lipocalin-like domain
MRKLSKSDLVGVWLLEAFFVHREDGQVFQWPGKQNGTLVYTENGYVSVARNRDPLPDATETDRLRTSNFYTGLYEPDLEHGRVFHTPLQSSVASIIGVRAERLVEMDSKGRLKLYGVGLKEKVTLVWRKV